MASHSAAASLRLKHVQSALPSSSAPTSTLAGQDGEFIQFRATMRIPIAPIFGEGPQGNSFPGYDAGMDGVREVLAGWVMRYLPPLRCILLSFTPTPSFRHPSAQFPAAASPFADVYSSKGGYPASPPPSAGEGETETVTLKTLPMVVGSGFTLAEVEWEGVGWRPKVGMKLVGTPTLSTPSHISLLLHNLFNASIPSSQIPTSDYEFDPEASIPAIVLERRNAALPLKRLADEVAAKAAAEAEENNVDEDKAVGTTVEIEDEEGKEEEELEEQKEVEEEEEEEYAERGWWVHRKSREPLGGKEGRIEFTLVGLATSNSLLSCTGSLLASPFSPASLALLSAPLPSSLTSTSLTSAPKSSKKRVFVDSDNDTGSSSSEDETDHDDDDRVGTGIPAGAKAGGEKKGGKPPKVRDASVALSAQSEGEESEASSRSPSPVPVVVAKKEKKEKKGEKKERKSKKVKV